MIISHSQKPRYILVASYDPLSSLEQALSLSPPVRRPGLLTVVTPCTCAWVPSGRVMTGLLGSTWMMLTVPSGLLMVCTTVCEYCDGTFCEEGRHGQELGRRWRRLLGSGGWRSGMSETEATRR